MDYYKRLAKFTTKWAAITLFAGYLNPFLGLVSILFWLGASRRLDVKEQRSQAIVDAYKEIDKRRRID